MGKTARIQSAEELRGKERCGGRREIWSGRMASVRPKTSIDKNDSRRARRTRVEMEDAGSKLGHSFGDKR
jgi:peptide methionine sulfoxide reductase MsrB